MRRFWFYATAIILVAGASAALLLATKSSKNHDDKNTGNPAVKAAHQNASDKNACTIFTLADAKQLMGDTAKGGTNPIDNSSPEFNVSNCTYTQDTGANAPISSRKSATLHIQAPKTATAEASNQNEFGPFKPAGVQDVAEYGDQAYWDAEHGQLNILKNNVWYILSYGPSTPSQRTLEQTRQLADLVAAKL